MLGTPEQQYIGLVVSLVLISPPLILATVLIGKALLKGLHTIIFRV